MRKKYGLLLIVVLGFMLLIFLRQARDVRYTAYLLLSPTEEEGFSYLAWHPSGKRLTIATKSRGFKTYFFEMHTAKETYTGNTIVGKLEWSPDGRFLAVCADGIWLLEENTDQISELYYFEPYGYFGDCVWNSDGTYFAAVSFGYEEVHVNLFIWNMPDGDLVGLIPTHASKVKESNLQGLTSLAWSVRDVIAILTMNGEIRLWDEATQIFLPSPSGTVFDDTAYSLLFNYDGSLLAVATRTELSVIDAVNGITLHTLPINNYIQFDWHPNENTIAIASESGIVIWQPQLGKTKQLENAPVRWVRWSPDGQHLAFTAPSGLYLLEINP